MHDSELRKTFHAAVSCYLSTMQTLADALAEACPAVGGPYRHRLTRLGTRLAFDANPTAIEESCAVVEAEVKEFAHKSSLYVDRHSLELTRALKALDAIAGTLSGRQEFYAARLRHFAAEMELASSPNDAGRTADPATSPAASLMNCVESMSQESQALIAQMREELRQVRERLRESETTDPVTGLLNRREMGRRIRERQSLGEPVTILLFTFSAGLTDEAAQQVGARLGSQLRFNDLICRWTSNKFLVLFQGLAETAESRAEQILPWVAGRYLLDSGATLELTAEAALVGTESLEAELAGAGK